MIETVCAKFRKQNHPNNTLLLTWAAFLSHFRPIYLDLYIYYIKNDICLLSFIMIFMIKILMLINIY